MAVTFVYRSHAPAWEFIPQRFSVAKRDAGASLTAFPRRSVGPMRGNND